MERHMEQGPMEQDPLEPKDPASSSGERIGLLYESG